MPNSTALYHLAFEAVSDLIFLVKVEADQAFRFVSVNPAYLRSTGLTGSHVIGARVEHMSKNNTAAQYLLSKYREAVRLRREIIFEERLELPSGVLHMETKLQPLPNIDGTISHLFGISRDITARKHAEQQLREANDQLFVLSQMDNLTGIANRRLFDDTLQDYAEHAIRSETPISIIMIDVDNFKAFNEHYGFKLGDECLRKIAGQMQQELYGKGLAARCGGDDFVALLPETGLWEATAAAERIRFAVEQLGILHAYSPAAPVVTVSIGVSCSMPTSVDQALQTVPNCEQVLCEAKSDGKNRVTVRQQQLPVEMHTEDIVLESTAEQSDEMPIEGRISEYYIRALMQHI